MSEITINLTKDIVMTVPNGQLKLITKGDTVLVEYHNPIFKGSPFKLSTSFSDSFTPQEIINSSEVVSFLARFK